MFWKFAVLIVSLGACACTLLAMRQSRLQAAHELAEAQLRIRVHDERLWRLRSDIAMRVAPAHVELMAADLGPTHPLLPPNGSVALRIPGVDGPVGSPLLPEALIPPASEPSGSTPASGPPASREAGKSRTTTDNPGSQRTPGTPPAERASPGRAAPKKKAEPPTKKSYRARLADRGQSPD